MRHLGVDEPAALKKQHVGRASKAQVVDHHSWVEESELADSGAGDWSLRRAEAAAVSSSSRALCLLHGGVVAEVAVEVPQRV